MILDQSIFDNKFALLTRTVVEAIEVEGTCSKGSSACSCLPLFKGKCNCNMQNCVFFLWSLDTFLLKNVIVLFFLEIKFQNGGHLKKGLLLTYFSHFLVTNEKTQKFHRHISHLHTYTYFAHPIDFFALPILQKLRIYHVWFLFGVTPGVDSFSRHFGAIYK